MICGKVTNLVEFMKAAFKAKKRGVDITKDFKMQFKWCHKKAVFSAKIKGTKGWHHYCARCFFRMWLPEKLTKGKVKLL